MPRKIGQAPRVIPTVFEGSRLIVYFLYNPSKSFPKELAVSAVSPDGKLSVVIPLSSAKHIRGDLLHKMAVNKKIREFEDANEIHTNGKMKSSITF